MNGAPRESAEHFYSLDVLRGIAALSVVFWHWKHFYFVGTILPDDLDETRQPLYAMFRVLYNHGDKAVDCSSPFRDSSSTGSMRSGSPMGRSASAALPGSVSRGSIRYTWRRCCLSPPLRP